MSFLNDVVVPGVTKTATTSTPKATGGFLSSVVMPTDNAITPPNIMENPKGSGYPALNPDGSQVTPNVPQDPYGMQKYTQGVSNSPIMQGVNGMIKGYNDVATQTQPKSFNMNEGLKSGWENLSSTITDSQNRLQHAVDTFQNHNATALQKGVSAGEAAMGGLNGVFSLITTPLAVMSRVPVVGHVVDKVNELFGALGGGGSALAQGVVDRLPLSQETKDTIKPLVGEIGALTAQIVAGKGGETLIPKITEKSNAVLEHIKNDAAIHNAIPDVPVTTEVKPTVKGGFLDSIDNKPKITEPAPAVTEATKSPTEIVKSFTDTIGDKNQVINGNTYADRTKILNDTIKPQLDNLPTPKADETIVYHTSENGKLEPGSSVSTNPEQAWMYADKNTQVKIVKTSDLKSTGLSGKDSFGERLYEPSVKQVEQKASKVGSSVEAKAVEKGLTQGFEGTAGYDPITIKDQALRASDLMQRDMSLAEKMVRGEVPMTPGLRPEMLIKAMEDHAQATGNVGMMRDIAKSPLVAETSVHAQAMRLLAERNPDSVVAKLREIKIAREKVLEKKGGKKLIKSTITDIKSEIVKASSKRVTWEEFIDEIKCNY